MERDLSSHSEPSKVVTTSFHLDWDVDFETKTVSGFVTHEFKLLKPTPQVILDTHSLKVTSVEDNTTGKPLTFELEEKKSGDEEASALGTPLVITLPSESAKTASVKISYSTTSSGQALQWLTKAQTSGKKHPYLFSQCQAIHARSLFPCQDTPIVKAKYTAAVKVPKPLVALMSSPRIPGTTVGNTNVFCFKQDIPICSYLVALAVGNLESRRVGPRSQVWSEPEDVEKVAYEFANTESFVAVGEEICGPYQWGIYDVLCMPPSFPYGGMENPCLTFVTPTLLAGDRSLEDVITHEVTHSWTGNLVTNHGWRHFWLNEGWTMFIQRKIMEKIYSKPFAQLDALSGLNDLNDTLTRFKDQGEEQYTKLVQDESKGDPDDAFSVVPYEKGFNFLYYLETKMGGPEKFAPFIKAYVKKFGGITLTSFDFKDFFCQFFKDEAGLADIDWDTWFNKPGPPPVKNTFDRSLLVAAEKLKQKILNDGEYGKDDIKDWKALQIMILLDELLESKKVDKAKMEAMKVFGFSESKNAELRFRWQKLGIQAEWQPIVPQAIQLATEQGRMKFTRPLYRALFKSEMGKTKAIEAFKASRDRYHPICAKMVAKDLGLA